MLGAIFNKHNWINVIDVLFLMVMGKLCISISFGMKLMPLSNILVNLQVFTKNFS